MSEAPSPIPAYLLIRNLDTSRQVEAYLIWNLNGTNNLVACMEAKVADIEAKLSKGNSETSKDKKRLRRGHAKAIRKLEMCKEEALMLQASIQETQMRIGVLEQANYVQNLFANPGPFLPSAHLESHLWRQHYDFPPPQGPQNLIWRHPNDFYTYIHSPSANPYIASPDAAPCSQLFPPLSYNCHPMSIFLPYTGAYNPNSSPPVTIVEADEGVEDDADVASGQEAMPTEEELTRGLQKMDLQNTFRSLDPSNHSHRATSSHPVSSNVLSDESPVISLRSRSPEADSKSETSTMPLSQIRRYSTAAVDLLMSRLNLSSSLGHRKGQASM